MRGEQYSARATGQHAKSNYLVRLELLAASHTLLGQPLVFGVKSQGGPSIFFTWVLLREELSLYGAVPSLPPAGRNAKKMKVLDCLSLCGGPSLPLADPNPPN